MFNWDGIVGHENVFTETPYLHKGMLYAAVLSRKELRALVAFQVVDLTQDGPLTIDYAILEWEEQVVAQQPGGFSWDQENFDGSSSTVQ